LIKTLSISNFAIIDNIEVNFSKGMTSITGETGAGKSIILGALSLVLGKRADLNILKDSTKKCVIEASFDISKYNLKSIFSDENIDYEDETILRRELIPSGKSRAFINDSPVKLEVLNIISSNLIDIHNQNETYVFFNKSFQYKFLDSFSDAINDSDIFKQNYFELKSLNNSYENLNKIKDSGIKEHDYQKFLLDELESLELNKNLLKDLENEVNELSNANELKNKLLFCVDIINSEERGVLSSLNEILSNLSTVKTISNKISDYYSRINSSYIELKDIINDIETHSEMLDNEPELLNIKNAELDKIYSVFKKHRVTSIEELILERDRLSKVFFDKDSLSIKINDIKELIINKKEFLSKLSKKIHSKRSKAIPGIEKELNSIVNKLGMKNAKFNFNLNSIVEPNEYGTDNLELLFSSNLGTKFKPIKNIISGGELSRVMLSIKYMVSKKYNFPTIIFDEIDSGVSGAVANEIGILMHSMAVSNQILTITHIPQVASRGDNHIKVYKEVSKNGTKTKLIKLSKKEREIEIASMLSGKKMTSSAIKHARELLD